MTYLVASENEADFSQCLPKDSHMTCILFPIEAVAKRPSLSFFTAFRVKSRSDRNSVTLFGSVLPWPRNSDFSQSRWLGSPLMRHFAIKRLAFQRTSYPRKA